MSISKTVNKTLVNGSEQFSYTVDFVFSDLKEPNQAGYITDFFPTNIEFSDPIIGDDEVVKSVDKIAVEGGTKVIFNLGEVSVGSFGTFNFFANFGYGRSDGDTFTNEVILYANDVELESGIAETVTLQLDENFSLSKNIESKDKYLAGDILEVTLRLMNTNDTGAEITNIIIQDVLATGFSAVTDFTPIGQDIEVNGYSDQTYDGKEGSWNENTLNFELPSYKGAMYEITFQIQIDEDVKDGQVIENIATWSVDGQARTDAKTSIEIYEEKSEAYFTKIGPLYANVGDDITYGIYMANTGTVDFKNAIWTDIIPSEVTATAFTLYTQNNRIDNYSIYITTTESPLTEILILNNIAGTNTVNFDLTPYTPDGGHIESLIIKANTVFADSYSSTLYIFGTVNDSVIQGQTFINESTLIAETTLENIDEQAYANTIVGSTSFLQIQKIASNTNLLKPLEYVYMSLVSSASSSGIVDPIFIDYLPLGLEYLVDSVYFRYSDIQEGFAYYSNSSDWPEDVPIPETEVIRDYDGTGRTFLRWDFTGFTVPYLNTLVVNFTSVVSAVPPIEMTNVAYLGNPGDDTYISGSSIVDEGDYDGDGIVNESIAQSNSIYMTALSSEIFKVEKFVKGEYAEDFSDASVSYAGGTGKYQLEVTNSFETNLKNIVAVDILPHVGDTGVILVDELRESEFQVFTNSVITAEIINIIGEVVDPNPEIIVEYSTSTNPIRFGQDGNTIGIDDDWTTIPPENLATIKSFKVSTGEDVILETFDKLIITVEIILSEEAEIGQIAYNSFAVKTSEITEKGEIIELLPIEPNKVSLIVEPSEFSSIGNLVWFDTNGDGIYDKEELGINGVTVELYSEKMELLETTITSYDPLTTTDGYYMFNKIVGGNYYVKFIPPTDYKLTIQKSDKENGSKPNQDSGFTNLITVVQGENILTIDAGIICNTAPIIYAEDRCVYQNETFNPLYDVIAEDCNGEKIELTEKNIMKNNVDITTVGTYTITYSVTSPLNGLETTKMIYIQVLESTIYHQAVTDVIESVALQQTGISHILNAEGEKIQKALEMGVSTEELLKINSSVESMVNSLTNLEMLLHLKLETLCVGCSSCIIDTSEK